MTPPTWFERADVPALLREFPLDEGFMQRHRSMSLDALHAHQDSLFRRCLARAWMIPFYRRLWGEAGIEVGDIRGLADIGKLPVYGKAEIMESVERAPPLGDFHGWDPQTAPSPIIVHTTSGTTGRPQPLVFGPRGREVQNILLARIYRMQGLRAGDVVHSVYGHGLINGGHYVREALTHYSDALFLSAGTGVETRSLRQVEIMRDFRANVVVGFADYIRKLAEVAAAEGILPGRDIQLRMISGHLGRESREKLSAAWGEVELYDWYGVGDTGAIAGEGPDHDGLYLMEDAQYVELLDVDSGQSVAAGDAGDLVVTCLYKDDLYPIIRFNTHDVTRLLPGHSSLGLNLRRIEGFLGRSDNMVKIRGINVYPQALGSMLAQHAAYAGEFVCIASRDGGGRDTLTLQVEVHGQPGAALAAEFAALMRAQLGVELDVQLCERGATSEQTGVETRQKPVRLIDRRFG